MAQAGGCSGPKYTMNFEAAPGEEDAAIEIRNVRLFLDEESMAQLTGATIDYSDAPDNFGFNFNAPVQQASSCGKLETGTQEAVCANKK